MCRGALANKSCTPPPIPTPSPVREALPDAQHGQRSAIVPDAPLSIFQAIPHTTLVELVTTHTLASHMTLVAGMAGSHAPANPAARWDDAAATLRPQCKQAWQLLFLLVGPRHVCVCLLALRRR